MSWKLNPDRPVYVQLIERITTDIIAGIYLPGSKLPSVRDLAQTAGVNPNTMQKALSEMERTNLVYSQRTSGRFITEDLSMIDSLKTELASEQVKEFLEKMEKIGLSKEDIIGLIQKVSEEEKNEYDF
ncbi:MAG: GntR family transcriptional regulator [Blautia marasmi]